MDAPHPDQPNLDAIAEAFAEAIRRGDNPSIDDVIAQHGEHDGQLRTLLESVSLIEGLKSPASGSGRTETETVLNIDQLDDYKIVRQIGRGGMGVVFEAIHVPLSRRVAVKVLASRAFEETKDVERFRREARAAARLRHSNIVPVFGVGKASDHHYYVMDYIDGISLREWLQQQSDSDVPTPVTIDAALDQTAGGLEFETPQVTSKKPPSATAPKSAMSPDYSRWVAKVGATICDALQYAHSQGILHRDIKPANLLIDQVEEVWIADFGLAKLAEQQGVTISGDLVGTPQYMPPESFDGTYDVRSEVYAVGLTLYELLAQRSAIQGRTPADVIRQATTGVHTSPRKFNATIPRDLETIVMKSLAPEPSARYGSAGAMCDDLTRFLADRPIQARRTGPVERAIRWSRREPAVATMTFTTFLLLIALAAVSAIGYWRTSESLAIASAAGTAAQDSLRQRTEALALAEEQRGRAEKNLQVALTAFDLVMRNITDRGIHADADLLGEVTDRISPNVTPDDARMLQSLLGFFDELASNNSEDLLAESALAARRAGDIYATLGELREADRAYSDALLRYDQLSDMSPGDAEPILAQSEIRNELAAILSLRGQLGRAMQVFGETIEGLESDENVLASADGIFQYARAHRLYASLSIRAGLDESLARLRPNANFRFKRSPIGTMLQLRTEDELAAANEAIKTLEQLLGQSPDAEKVQAELARAYRTKARVSSRANRRSESELSIRRSIDLFEQLLSSNPQSESIRYELAMTLSSSEAFGFNQMRRSRRAMELSESLIQQHPQQKRFLALRAQALETLGKQQARAGALREAEKSFAAAIEDYDQVLDQSPELKVYMTFQAGVMESMAELKLRQGKPDLAIQYLREAIQLLRPGNDPGSMSPLARIQFQRLRQKLDRIDPDRINPDQ